MTTQIQTQQTQTHKPEKSEPNINLGDRVKDNVTGFEGIAVACIDWISGQRRWVVQGKLNKDGVPQDPQTFDESYLTVIENGALKYSGGGMPRAGQTAQENGGRIAAAPHR